MHRTRQLHQVEKRGELGRGRRGRSTRTEGFEVSLFTFLSAVARAICRPALILLSMIISYRSASLEYVYLMHVVQERKKFDFVETLLSFMHSWSNYYQFGHERTQASSPYMKDLKVRENSPKLEMIQIYCDIFEKVVPQKSTPRKKLPQD